MTDQPTGSTVPRRQLGRYLRDLRNQARLTVRAAATKLEWSEAKMWRIETGQTSLRSLDVEAMCKIYGAQPGLTDALMSLAKETKARGWWHSYADVMLEGLDLYIGLEEAAASLHWYEAELIPGLFQTEGYAAAIIRANAPDADGDLIQRRLDLRMARQALVTRPTDPPGLSVVLNEAVLRRPVGGSNVMAGQLGRLLDLAELPHVAIKVMPFEAGLHHGLLSGPFVILRFPVNGDGRDIEPPTVYVDGFTGTLYLDKPHEIDLYAAAFESMWSVALDEAGSRELVATVKREMST